MKLPVSGAKLSSLFLILFFLVSCVSQDTETEIEPPAEPVVPVQKVEKLNQLPVQYQAPSYMVSSGNIDDLDDVAEDVAIKVGASIRSTQGPQPLWDILKRVASLKKMSVSWASDVDQNVLVDVDISADDDFYAAIDNLLRQVDYYHDMQGSTIVVHYKETRQFHVAMPFTKSLFETATGGNVLGSNDSASNIEGTIRLDSRGNEFDIWKNIQDNMDAILDTWSTSTATVAPAADTEEGAEGAGTVAGSRQVSASGNKYTIDKPIGLITVHAPRPLLDKLEIYFTNLKRELYKQVSIEAKIIEVHFTDHSSIGLDWNMLLSSLSMAGAGYNFNTSRSQNSTRENTFQETSLPTRGAEHFLPTGVGEESYRWNESTNAYDRVTIPNTVSVANAFTADGLQTDFPSLGVTKVITNAVSEAGGAVFSMAAFTFDSFLNAVKEQGETTILSNPKISVLNGQPSLITVGRNVTYIDSIESDVSESGVISLTVNTERVLSGVGLALTANILDDKEIILNLVPVTSELQEPIEYRSVGVGTVGLPIINVREMSTTVKVRDGEMLVIGGLISNVDEDEGTFIPGTSGIPFFKYFFGFEEKSSRKRELIILLRPRII